MCDTELIAAILEEVGYLDNEKRQEKKEDINELESDKDNSKNSGEEEI